MDHLMFYLLIINALGALFMLADKIKAIRGSWRIAERVLLGIAALGGSFGCYLGMLLFRHKTRKPRFSIGLPVMAALHTLILIFLYQRFPVIL